MTDNQVDLSAKEYFQTEPDRSPLPSRSEAIERVSAAIYGYAAILLEEATAQYAASEAVTWPRKEAEARAYLSSKDAADAPLLAIEAETAQIELITLANTVIRKADAYWALAAQIAGMRSFHLQVIAGMTDVEAVLDYNYSIGW